MRIIQVLNQSGLVGNPMIRGRQFGSALATKWEGFSFKGGLRKNGIRDIRSRSFATSAAKDASMFDSGRVSNALPFLALKVHLTNSPFAQTLRAWHFREVGHRGYFFTLLILGLFAVFVSTKACMGKFKLGNFILPTVALLYVVALVVGGRWLSKP